jgi:glycosyltransferase involved in cell wall biosynthesis
MMEVMSMGIPVIGLNVGAVSEIVVDGESGKLLDASATSKQIADAILYYSKLSNDTFMIEKQKAYNFWNNNFNAHTNYKSFANTLKS